MSELLTVSQFISQTNQALSASPGLIGVQGEVSNYKVSRQKLVFFDLKDQASYITCFALKHEVPLEIESGMEVRIWGQGQLFKTSGRFHLRVQRLELGSLGALQRAFELTKKKLTEEGLFADDHKQDLSPFPNRIGLITSSDAAAYTDVLQILNNRWPWLEVKFKSVGVQGPGASKEIVEALDYFNKYQPVETLILTRGGGSLEDLQSFNNEAVVRAIFASKTPVVVGVGHERDFTLADLVADVRASTPSNAAERVVPDKLDVLRQVSAEQLRLSRQFKYLINSQLMEVDSLAERNKFQWQNKLQQLTKKINQYQSMLEVLNPQSILDRGYSLTVDQAGKVITDWQQLKIGAKIKTRFKAGVVDSSITKVYD